MGTGHIQKIRKLDWLQLRDLWTKIKVGRTPGWSPGKALEHLVLRAFELDGADVRWPYDTSLDGEVIEQIDGAIHVDGLSCLVECKDTSSAVSIEPIAKLRTQLMRRPAGAVGLVFSRSGFTSPALTLAQFLSPQMVLLWSGDEIDFILHEKKIRAALKRKYRSCVETGQPDFDVRMEASL